MIFFCLLLFFNLVSILIFKNLYQVDLALIRKYFNSLYSKKLKFILYILSKQFVFILLN